MGCEAQKHLANTLQDDNAEVFIPPCNVPQAMPEELPTVQIDAVQVCDQNSLSKLVRTPENRLPAMNGDALQPEPIHAKAPKRRSSVKPLLPKISPTPVIPVEQGERTLLESPVHPTITPQTHAKIDQLFEQLLQQAVEVTRVVKDRGEEAKAE